MQQLMNSCEEDIAAQRSINKSSTIECFAGFHNELLCHQFSFAAFIFQFNFRNEE